MICGKCKANLPNLKGKIRCRCGHANYGKDAGLGDTVQRVVARVIGDTECGGCKKRRDLLNRLVPYEDGATD